MIASVEIAIVMLSFIFAPRIFVADMIFETIIYLFSLFQAINAIYGISNYT